MGIDDNHVVFAHGKLRALSQKGSLSVLSQKQDNYETVCQNLLEILLVCMLRNDHLSVVEEENSLLNRECAQIKNYLDANYAEDISLDTLVFPDFHDSPSCIVFSETADILLPKVSYLLLFSLLY